MYFNYNPIIEGCANPLCHPAAPPAHVQPGSAHPESEDHIPAVLTQTYLLPHHLPPAHIRNPGWLGSTLHL